VVGYTGGIKPNPTYRNIMDHTEALLVEYDPNVVSYDDLLVEWSKQHNPVHKNQMRQYRSAVWYLDDDQRDAAEEVLEGMKALSKAKIYSSVDPATKFYMAEEYHQNYMAKHAGLEK